jgi:hypothetical protein
VLSHGFPELAYSWRHQIPAIAAAGYHVVAPDQRGYGRSSRPEAIEDYDIHHLTDELLDILDRGGPSFRLADPSTWAEQASLALHNRWGDLKRLQRDLHASTIGDGRDGVT